MKLYVVNRAHCPWAHVSPFTWLRLLEDFSTKLHIFLSSKERLSPLTLPEWFNIHGGDTSTDRVSGFLGFHFVRFPRFQSHIIWSVFWDTNYLHLWEVKIKVIIHHKSLFLNLLLCILFSAKLALKDWFLFIVDYFHF